ncbi:MAG: hypothetical protein IK108_09250, partial [Clostridia bacterium]|nr:hypothetical protein [Clostridia bacterium]
KEANISESGKAFNLIVGAGMTARKPLIQLSLMYAIKHTMRLHKVNCNGWFLRAVMPAPTNKQEPPALYHSEMLFFQRYFFG